jgi:HTH-type transcriptional regulator / antitoxin HigA
MAESVRVSAYSESAMRGDGLAEPHRLTNSEQEVRKVPSVLAESGIRFVVVERLSKMQIDGVAFWLSEYDPVVALTLRADRIDGFWFTLAHEIAHILNHDQPGLDANQLV